MRRGVNNMGSGSRLVWVAGLTIALSGFLSSAVCGQSSPPALPPGSSTAGASAAVLPANVVIPLSMVNRFFPEVTREASTGQNKTAVGRPKATRGVIYANAGGSKQVTVTVDQYKSPAEASSAYHLAVQKSKIPGFKPIAVAHLGQQAFAGTVTKGAETHVGLGALDGKLIVGVTLAGYEATPDNLAKLVEVARAEQTAANKALDAGGSR
jgi:hypothetical protein